MVQIVVGTTNGNVYHSDVFTDEQIIEEFSGYPKPRITGAWAEDAPENLIHPETVDDVVELMSFSVKKILGDQEMSSKNFSIIIDGNYRHFNVEHIEWIDVKR